MWKINKTSKYRTHENLRITLSTSCSMWLQVGSSSRSTIDFVCIKLSTTGQNGLDILFITNFIQIVQISYKSSAVNASSTFHASAYTCSRKICVTISEYLIVHDFNYIEFLRGWIVFLYISGKLKQNCNRMIYKKLDLYVIS